MIIKFFKLILFIFEFIANAIAFVFARLGLWGGGVFLIASVIYCAIFSIPITGTALNVVVIGTVICSALSIYLTMCIVANSKKKKKDALKKSKSKDTNSVNKKSTWKKTDKYDYVDNISEPYSASGNIENSLPKQNIIASEPLVEKPPINDYTRSAMISEQERQKKLAQEREKFEQEEKYRQKYFASATSLDDRGQNILNEKYNKDEKNNSNFDYDEKLSVVNSHEKPLVFATRKDPNIMILEYSDRLMFYKKTNNGPQLISTEYKSKN